MANKNCELSYKINIKGLRFEVWVLGGFGPRERLRV